MRRLLLGVAVAGAVAGLLVAKGDVTMLSPAAIWTAATLPVIVVLLLSIVRDLLAGRVGVDAIALISMVAALMLGQPL
ncbi:MAG: heavy metal translocating P-type ATPase, partial [Rhizobiaceae bacterium]|nr:heavy metal translocating P-type ATPase [Rhizobiaceae bacterium]